MKTSHHINDKFVELSDFVGNLPENYNSTGQLVHSGRNEVRIVQINGLVLAVKYFKRMTLANRFIYATFRKSKAQRAFENSAWLLKKGITSPENVAFIDCYEYSLLKKSFFVSLFTDYKPIKELFSLTLAESEEGLKAFARFTHLLHQKGVFHYDYSASNILYSNVNGQYDFALIDINRMKISKYSFKRGIRTLNRLVMPVEQMGIVAAEYSRISGINDLEVLNAMTLIRLLHQLKNVVKKWIKSPLRYFAG